MSIFEDILPKRCVHTAHVNDIVDLEKLLPAAKSAPKAARTGIIRHKSQYAAGNGK
jgi:hypothetical protein